MEKYIHNSRENYPGIHATKKFQIMHDPEIILLTESEEEQLLMLYEVPAPSSRSDHAP